MADTNWEEEIRLLEVQAINFSTRYMRDHAARQYYIRNIRAYVAEVRGNVSAGSMTHRQGAEAASQMRNQIMEAARVRSSDIGRAGARSMKAKGLAFDDLVKKYSSQKFGKAYENLTGPQQREIMDDLISAAARDNPKVTAKVSKLGKVSRVLFVLTIAVACYNVYNADNKAHAAGREATTIGGGFAGGAAGGAAAGIWFGPIGVAVGVAVGGIVGAMMADEVYLEMAGVGNKSVDAIIDPYTSVFSTDVNGLAQAIIRECGINMDRAMAVFQVLDRDYSMASDNVAAKYVSLVRSTGGSVQYALKMHGTLRSKLVDLLTGGISVRSEKDLANWVKAL